MKGFATRNLLLIVMLHYDYGNVYRFINLFLNILKLIKDSYM